MSQIRAWKKVYETDLPNIVIELKEVLSTPCVLFLDGLVGAGKTTFSKVFINSNEVQSPTYSIINEHDQILHADLYRIEKREDLIQLEIPMYTEEKDYFLIEWGMPYQSAIEKILGDEFKTYQLKIDINESADNKAVSRNYSLFKL